MEKVQKRMTRMLPDLKNMSYLERLKILGLTSPESRRLRGDLIEVFKIIKGFDNIDRNIFLGHMNIRGHQLFYSFFHTLNESSSYWRTICGLELCFVVFFFNNQCFDFIYCV